ncbi:MAG: hypothetical protein J6T16_04475 [Opitutales bacterium]|nr:hypothetical protein [Opitutales bacterium]
MRKFFEILSAALVLGFLNYLINPNRPELVKTMNFKDCANLSGWIFVAPTGGVPHQKIPNLVFLDDISFDSQILKLLEIWSCEKNVGILQTPKSREIAKKLRSEYRIGNVYILEDWQ